MSLELSGIEPNGQRRRLLDDPVTIRALAHPVRLELLRLVGRSPGLTTADAARTLDISHGLASHHLRQLAKYGFVEQMEGKDNRERPWRAIATSLNWPADDPTSESAAAGDVLDRVFAERSLQGFIDWQQRRALWPAEWREHTGRGQSTIYLTLAELAEITELIDSALRRYIDERPIDDVAARPPGSVPIDFSLFVVPLSDRPEDA